MLTIWFVLILLYIERYVEKERERGRGTQWILFVVLLCGQSSHPSQMADFTKRLV